MSMLTQKETSAPITLPPPPPGEDPVAWYQEQIDIMVAQAAAKKTPAPAIPADLLLLAAIIPEISPDIVSAALPVYNDAPPQALLKTMVDAGTLEPAGSGSGAALQAADEQNTEKSAAFDEFYRMPAYRRAEALAAWQEKNTGPSNRSALIQITAMASSLSGPASGTSASKANKVNAPLRFSHRVRAWGEMARWAAQPPDMADIITERTSEIYADYQRRVQEARRAQSLWESTRQLWAQEVSADIEDFIAAGELLRPLYALPDAPTGALNGVATLDTALVRAARIPELLSWEESDRRHLREFLARHEQIEVLRTFLDGPRDLWALHLLGSGGAGKTMLLRHLVLNMAEAGNVPFAAARVDFDYLNPDYPRLSPGLLLTSFAAELIPQIPGEDDARPAAIRNFQQAERIFDKLQSLRRQESQSASSGGLGVDAIVQHPEFQEALAFYIAGLRAFSNAGRGVLLVIDTCEELAKTREGEQEEPINVRATFCILEALQNGWRKDQANRETPLRVVFSGRRPLASSGPGWRMAADLPLSPRSFLLLHEIRGFRAEEARAYLDAANPTVPKEDNRHEAILARSKSEESGAGTVVWNPNEAHLQEEAKRIAALGASASLDQPGQAGSPPPQRYLAYELRHFADWVRAETPPPTAAVIRDATSTQYVEHRILHRLQTTPADRLLREILPTVALLGRFSQETLRAVVMGTGAATTLAPEDFAAVYMRLRQQEWTSLKHFAGTASPQARSAVAEGAGRSAADLLHASALTVIEVDPGVQRRLLEYYAKTGADTRAKEAERNAAKHLHKETLRGDLKRIDVSTVDATLRILERQRKPKALANWWEAFEKRLWKERGAEDWVKAVVSVLLRPGGAGEASVLRSALWAAYAASLQTADPERDSALRLRYWREAYQTYRSYPTPKGSERIREQSIAAIVNLGRFVGWSSIQTDELTVCRDVLQRYIGEGDGFVPENAQEQGVLLAAAEGLVEHSEAFADVRAWLLLPIASRPARDGLSPEARVAFFGNLSVALRRWMETLSNADASPRPGGLFSLARQQARLFFFTLAWRAGRLGDKTDIGEGFGSDFILSLIQEAAVNAAPLVAARERMFSADMTRVWTPPRDLAARNALEMLRLLSPLNRDAPLPWRGLGEIGQTLFGGVQKEILLRSLEGLISGGPDDVPIGVDGERARSALLRVRQAYDDSVGTLLPFKWSGIAAASVKAESGNGNTLVPECRAHIETPPLFVTLAELAEQAGQGLAAERMLREILAMGAFSSSDASRGLTSQRESGRLLAAAVEARRALIALHRRLRIWDDRSADTPNAIALTNAAVSLRDLAPLWEKGVLTGDDLPFAPPPNPSDTPDVAHRARFWHVWWRSESLGPSTRVGVPDRKSFPDFAAFRDEAVGLLFSTDEPSAAASAAPLAQIALDLLEDRLSDTPLIPPPAAPDLSAFVDPHALARSLALVLPNVLEAAGTEEKWSLLLRAEALGLDAAEVYQQQGPRCEERLGKHRAATIAQEEGELLALRLPARAILLFTRASDLFAGANEPAPALLAEALATLCRLHSPLTNAPRLKALSRLNERLRAGHKLVANLDPEVLFPLDADDLAASVRALCRASEDGASSLGALLVKWPRRGRPLAVRVLRALILLISGEAEAQYAASALDTLEKWAQSELCSPEIPELRLGRLQKPASADNHDAKHEKPSVRAALLWARQNVGLIAACLIAIAVLLAFRFVPPLHYAIMAAQARLVLAVSGLFPQTNSGGSQDFGLYALYTLLPVALWIFAVFGWKRWQWFGKTVATLYILLCAIADAGFFVVVNALSTFGGTNGGMSDEATWALTLLLGMGGILAVTALRAIGRTYAQRRWSHLALFRQSGISGGTPLRFEAALRRERKEKETGKPQTPVSVPVPAVERWRTLLSGEASPVTAGTEKPLTGLLRIAFKQVVPMVLAAAAEDHGPAWEAAVAGAAGTGQTTLTRPARKNGGLPFAFRRSVSTNANKSAEKNAAAVVTVWAQAPAVIEFAHSVWDDVLAKQGSVLLRVRHRLRRQSPPVLNIETTNFARPAPTPDTTWALSDAETGILHLIGRVEETNLGLIFRLASDGSFVGSKAALSPEIAAADIVRHCSRLAACILQAEPLWDAGPAARPETERRDAERLRRFAADLQVRGVPVVAVVPALAPYPAGVPAVRHIARTLTRGRANALPALYDAFGRARGMVAEGALPSPRLVPADVSGSHIPGSPELPEGLTIETMNNFVESETLLVSPYRAWWSRRLSLADLAPLYSLRWHWARTASAKKEKAELKKAWTRILNRRLLENRFPSRKSRFPVAVREASSEAILPMNVGEKSRVAVDPIDLSVAARSARDRAWDICLFAQARWDNRMPFRSRRSQGKKSDDVSESGIHSA